MIALRRTALAAVAVASVAALGACTSQPSAKAVAKDIVQSIGLPAEQQECMLGVIDDMSESDLDAIGEANRDEIITDTTSGDEDLQAFMAALDDCRQPG